MTTFSGPDWAAEYLAARQVADLARDPDDFRVTRQSAVTVSGLLMSVSVTDDLILGGLFGSYEAVYRYYRQGKKVEGVGGFENLTATMRAMIDRAAWRAKTMPDFNYIPIDPRDYTIFTAPHVDVPVVCVHTRPERCWFLGILKFEGALGLSLGRMRVMRPTKQGVYPVTIRTKWRALTNKKKQEEVRDAYRRLLRR